MISPFPSLSPRRALALEQFPSNSSRDEPSPVYFDVAGLASFCYSGASGSVLSAACVALCVALVRAGADADAKKTGDRQQRMLLDLGKVRSF